MRFLGLIYVLAALAFFFFPNEIFYLINVGPRVFRITEAIPDSNERFWLVLATSMVAMLSALSFLAAERPKIRGFALVQILSKVVSSAGFLYLFLNQQRFFAYLIGIAIDFPTALMLTWITVRVPRPLEPGDPHP